MTRFGIVSLKEKFMALSMVLGAAISPAMAEVSVNSLFASHAVLQRDVPLPIWGTGTEGEQVTVTLGDETVTTLVREGEWRVQLKPRPAGGPHRLVVQSASNTITCEDMLIGDVWVCAGQSNMARQLGPFPPQPEIENWKWEVEQASHPTIRQYHVPLRIGLTPVADAQGNWTVCSPQTVTRFSAVGYFFARDLQPHVEVPIGLLFTAWGGTVAEAWARPAALAPFADFKDSLEAQKAFAAAHPGRDPDEVATEWFAENDPGSSATDGWHRTALEHEEAWQAVTVPPSKLAGDSPAFDGIAWFRKRFSVPENFRGKPAVLNLGAINDTDTVWLNGVLLGTTDDPRRQRAYRVAPDALKVGENVLAVRVLNRNGRGGFAGKKEDLKLRLQDEPKTPAVPLAGEWLYRASTPMRNLPPLPVFVHKNLPGVLHHGMVAPLTRFPIKGVVWYQGEANAGQAERYRTLFPALIADWRAAWAQATLPFLFVQITPHRKMPPELRDAQLMTLQRVPHTAMAVTIDCGDPADIHPAKKQPVGARLARAARAVAYGEKIEHSGPLLKSAELVDGRVVLTFSHLGDGLVAKDGTLRGFTLAGEDGKEAPARASIDGETITVTSPEVPTPRTVGYGWHNVPDGNLYNAEGLPASPFRAAVPFPPPTPPIR